MIADVTDESVKRSLVLMFADIERSTSNIFGLDPEDARAMLGPAVNKMRDLVHHYGGVVARTQGDGILALFGVGQLDAEHALNACLAGRAIADFFTQNSVGDRALSARVGIHAGHVLVHKTTNDFGQNLDVTGFPVHVAAKVEKHCPSNSVAISGDAMSLLRVRVDATRLALSAANDLLDDYELFELNSVAKDGGAQTRAPGSRTDCLVGRELELRDAAEWLNSETPSGGLLIIRGRAGIGKSRLCHEISKHHRTDGQNLFQIHGLKSRQTHSFAAFANAISGVLNVSGDASAGAVSSALDGIGVADTHLDPILDLLGSKHVSKHHRALEAQPRKRAIQSAISAVLETISGNAGLLCLVEDLHWIDEASLEVIRVLVDGLKEGNGLRFLASSRHSDLSWIKPANTREIELSELGQDDAIALIQRFSADRNLGLDDDFVRRLAVLTGGVPFYIKAYCQSLRENELIPVEKLPVGIEILVQGHVDNLSDSAKELMQYLALSGGGLETVICHDLMGGQARLKNAMQELTVAEMVISGSNGMIGPSHDLLAQACRKQLLRAERISRNQRIYAALASVHDSQGALDRLAHHAAEAGLNTEALSHYWSACSREVRRANITALAELYTKVMDVCDRVGVAADMKRAEFTLLTFDSFYQMGALDGLLERVSKAAEISRHHQNSLCEAQALAHIATLEWMNGRHKIAYDSAENAFQIAEQEGITPLIVYAWFSMANALHGQGELTQAIEKMEGLIEFLRGDLENMPSGTAGMPSVLSRALLIWFLCQSGNINRALELEQEALSFVGRRIQNYAWINIDAASGLLNQTTGNYELALVKFQASYDRCIKQEMLAMAPRAAAGIGQCLVRSGKAAIAHDFLKKCIDDRIYLYGGRYNWVYLHVALAEACQLMGRQSEALEVAKLALVFAEENDEPTSICVSRLTLADLQLMSGEATLAQKNYAAASELAQRLEMRPALAFAKAGHALAQAIDASGSLDADLMTEIDGLFQTDAIRERFHQARAAIAAGAPLIWMHDAV